MEDVFIISLPDTASESDRKAIQDTIKQIDAVEDAGPMKPRGMDPGTLMLWVQLAGGIMGVVGTAVPIIAKVIEMVRGKGISGAKITLSDGTIISVDNASATELERLIAAGTK